MHDDADIQRTSIETADILQALLDNITDSVVVMDKHYKVICFNNLAQDTLRSIHHKDLKAGDDYRGFVKDYNMDLFLESFDKAIGGVAVALEKEIIIQEQKKWFYLQLNPVYGRDKELLGVTFTITDIDWGKKKERALARSSEQLVAKTKELEVSEKYYRTLIETSSNAVVLIDGSGKVTYQSPSTERISGYTLAEIQAIDGLDLIHPDDREGDQNAFRDLASTPGGILNRKHRLKHKNGQYIWIDGTYRNLFHDENIKAIVYTYVDVTEKVQATERLARYNNELRFRNRINDLIIQNDHEQDLYRAVCKCMVEDEGYRLAMIYHLPGKNKIDTLQVMPICVAGDVEHNTEGLAVSLKDEQWLTANTLLTGATTLDRNIQDAGQWTDVAKRLGISSAISIPLKYRNSVSGAITICSADAFPFQAHDVMILERMAHNLSLAIQNIRTKNDIIHTRHLLKERVKELSTIYHLHNILQDEKQSVDEAFRKIVNILPPGWQHTDVCEARIEFNGQVYTTGKYKPSEYSQTAKIVTRDGGSGYIEVVYTKECPPDFEGPFLREERNLIDALAEIIQVYFNKKSSQEALSRSEALFRGAFEFSAIGMALVGLDNRWLVVNKELCKILGYTEAEVLAMSTHEITVPEDQERESPLLKKTIEGEIEHFTIEKRYIRKDGVPVWVRRCVSLIRNADHTPLYFVSQVENINEQKLITEQLKANENLLQLFVQHSPAALAMFDMNMRYVQVSRRWISDYNLNDIDIIGKSHYEIFPTIPQAWKDIHSRCLNGTIEANEEDSFVREDGTRAWLKWEIHPWRDVAGEIGGIIMLTEVITEKIESHLKFQNLVEMSLVGVYILVDGRFAYVNPHIVEESGYTDEELRQMPIAHFIHPEDIPTVYRNIQARLNGEMDSVSYEIRVYKKNGELMWLEMFGSMTLYKGVNAVIGTMVNITERKSMEIERQRMITDLMSRNKELHEFAQMVSHNLRGPLSTILGLSNMLKEEITEEDKNFVLEGFGVSAEKLDIVVRQMNDILNARVDLPFDRQTSTGI